MPHTGLEIAVIGMAGRFPGAGDIAAFWDNLTAGKESVSFLTDEELLAEGVPRELLQRQEFVKSAGGLLDGADRFDAAFFGYSPPEARYMSPQIRLFHQCAWEAMEDAGYVPGRDGTVVGVYAGAYTTTYWETGSLGAGGSDVLAAYYLNNRDFLATLISYKLNLRGPSICVNTACSTSLAAIHLACQGLLGGDCSLALAGGVTVRFPLEKGYLHQEGMIASPDGHTRAFDAQSAGTVGGDGIGVVMLKPLEDAVRDRDHIYASIIGSALNNDGGRKVGFTAPSVEGQAEVISNALRMAEAAPESIGYIECHGTGTPLGDCVEVEALNLAFAGLPAGSRPLGSAKTNLGHLDIAAGAAGFIKTVLCLQHRQIPPSLFFERPNPQIDFAGGPFYVNRQLSDWPEGLSPRRAAVSSFGVGGTNAHVILQEHIPSAGHDASLRSKHLLLLSAQTETALSRMKTRLAERLATDPALRLADVAYTLQTGRKHFRFRAKTVCSSVDEAVEKLRSSSPRAIQIHDAGAEPTPRRVVFLFSGLGRQYPNMGRELYDSELVFRRELDRCFDLLSKQGWSHLKDLLFPAAADLDGAAVLLRRFDNAQLAVFVYEYALARLLRSWGFEPAAMIGYSFGEFSAACQAEVFSLEDALKLLMVRGRLIGRLPAGVMLSIPLPADEVAAVLPEGLALAIDNGPSCVVSGPPERVETFGESMRERKLMCVPLESSHALHSAMMEPVTATFAAALEGITLHSPRVPYISTVTGDWIRPGDAVSPAYWARQMRETVQFAAGLKQLIAGEDALFLEIGPGRDLNALAGRAIENLPRHKSAAMGAPPQTKNGEASYLFDKIGLCWCYGAVVDWQAVHAGQSRSRVSLPTYPFEETTFPIEFPNTVSPEPKKNLTPQEYSLAESFHLPYWKQESVLHDEPVTDRPGHWLVMANRDQTGAIRSFDQTLVNSLQNRGNRVTVVYGGEEYSAKEDYERLVQKLLKEGKASFPTQIVHLWGTGQPEPQSSGRAAFDACLAPGYYSLLYLAQALVKAGVAVKGVDMDENTPKIGIHMTLTGVCAISGDEELRPELTPVLGLCKTIPQEYPNLVCRGYDIQLKLPEQLLDEWSRESGPPLTAFRGAFRYVRDFRRQRLESQDGVPALLRERGVYLITGGLGNDSFARAKYLARTLRARLILTGRTTLPDRQYWSQYLMLNGNDDPVSVKINRVLELEELGAEVEAVAADVADEMDMRLALAAGQRRFGSQLNGVIHAAGVTDIQSSRLVMELGPEESHWHFQPKVYGLYVLEKLLRDRDLDFCLLTSSIASVIAGIGLSAYTAASSFMDAFALKKNLDGSWFPWIVLNWLGAPEEETVEAFKRVLSARGAQRLVYCPTDLKQLIQQRVEAPQERAPGEAGLNRPDLANEYVAPRTATEQRLAEIWQAFFGIDAIGVDDDIFDLGGDSLKAINILAIVQKEMNVQIPVNEFFQAPSIAGLANFLDRDSEAAATYVPIPPAEEMDWYPLSSAQQRMFLFQQMNPHSVAYNSPVLELLTGQLDIKRLTHALQTMIQRHDSLRTAMVMNEGEPCQRVFNASDVPFQLETYDAADGIEAAARRFVRPFDLFQPPLFRVGLARLDDHRYLLLEDTHHIITDAVSIKIFQREFTALYSGHTLPPLSLQYKDFSQWRRCATQQEAIQQQEDFWLRQFQSPPPPLDLPLDAPRPASRDYSGRRLHFQWPADLGAGLKTLASQHGATLFMTLLTALSLLLAKLGGNRDIVVGTPVAGRSHPDLETVIGVFINTLALRVPIDGAQTVADMIGAVKELTLEAFANQDYPFETLVEKTAFQRTSGRHPLFDVLFLFQDGPQSGAETETQLGDDLMMEPVPFEVAASKFDLTFILVTQGDELLGSVEYGTALFHEETIQRLIACLRQIAAVLTAQPAIPVSEVEMISSEEKERILRVFNDTAADVPDLPSIQEIFHHQVERTPDRIAMVEERGGPCFVTYRHAQTRVRDLAARLRRAGVAPGSIVPIMTQRSVSMVTAAYAVLEAGCAYLPLDPDYPRQRRDYILADCAAGIMVEGEDIVVLQQSRPVGDCSNPLFAGAAYVIYTSGSTGRPKGVLVSQNSVVNILWDLQRLYPLEEDQAYLLKTSFVFDVSVTELFGWCWCGGRLAVLPPDDEKDPAAITRFIARQRVTHINFVPSMFNVVLDWLETTGATHWLASLRYVFLAGEAMWRDLARRFTGLGLSAVLENIYGPTEGTIYALRYSLGQWDGSSRIPIGVPMANCGALVLDADGNLQPVGVPGELCLFGRGLARGYLNRPELTRERFVPCHKDIDAPLYKTGDRARFLGDGTIDYLGRLDHQVKIRGFRVELGEIEACLLEHPAVREAAVLIQDAPSGDSMLTAFITGQEAVDLNDHLQGHLPSYMIPSRITRLEALPLNMSGKLDRVALALLTPDSQTTEIEPPQNEQQRQLAAIWARVLDLAVENIGIDDNFFQLGGHSLKAALAMTRIQKTLDIQLPAAQLFETPTIRSLAQVVESRRSQQFAPLPAVEQREFYPLSPAQKRLFILQQLDPDSTSYNMPDFFIVDGQQDLAEMASAVESLVARHESFRTSFVMVNGEPAQIIHPHVPFLLETTDLDDFVRPFDLAQPPLLRLGTAVSPAGDTILMLDTHHIISDGVSTSLILNELAALLDGRDPGPLPLQYKDFVLWQRDQAGSPPYLEAEAYWLERFNHGVPQLNLPLDNPRPVVFDPRGGSLTVTLTPPLTVDLDNLARRQGTTMFQTLLALYFVMLSKLSGQAEVAAGTPVSGRLHPDSQSIVGMFVNTLVLRADANNEILFSEFLEEVKLSVQEGIRHQSMQFEDLVERLAVERDPARHPLFDTMFVLQEEAPEFPASDQWCLSPYSAPNPPVKCDLALIASREGADTRLHFQFAAALFQSDTIRRFTAYFQTLALAAAADSYIPIAALDMIPAQEKILVLETFNATDAPFPGNQTLHGLVSLQSEKTPNAIALATADGGERLTYQEMKEQALAWADRLRRQGVGKGGIVALAMDPSPELVVAMLAVMTAGCAYLPLDPGSPHQRVARILKDSGAGLLLTQARFLERFDGLAVDVAACELTTSSDLDSAMPAAVAPGDPAYVIFTSGSTGVPKGVVVSHRAITNMIQWRRDFYQMGVGDVVLQLASPAFDASVEEIFSPLASGARLATLDPALRFDLEALKTILQQVPVTHLSLVPGLYRTYLNHLSPYLGHLRFVTVGGEQCPAPLVKQHFELLGHARLVNEYGPSETSVCATAFTFTSPSSNVLIGRPIANAACYVVDPNGYPVPLGVAGQLCVAGAGLADGYLNRPDLTTQAFGTYSPVIPQRLYQTGDLARWLPDGNLEFLGRVDRQVKIRGFRVELEEIEARLAGHPHVQLAAVLVSPPPQPELRAWVTAANGNAPDQTQLAAYLAEALPQYMIPPNIEVLAEMPLTPSGKIDRRRLLAMPYKAVSQATFVAPRTELEARVAAAWKEVLAINKVGLNDNFFAIGGNSLKVMELAATLQTRLGRPVPVVELFKRQTIAAFTAHLETPGPDADLPNDTQRRQLQDTARRRRDIQKNRRRR